MFFKIIAKAHNFVDNKYTIFPVVLTLLLFYSDHVLTVSACEYVNRYLVRVVAAYNMTKVTYATADNQLSGSTTLIRGHHVDLDTASALHPMKVECDQPCLVMRYNKGKAVCGDTTVNILLLIFINLFRTIFLL